jgi:6-pyruvoyl-tetrahydropterin synthase
MFDKEFIDESLGSKPCKLLIVKTPDSETWFGNFLTKYLKSKLKRVIGFDLEFNTPPGSKGQRQIAIFQIAFYLSKYVLVVFFNPRLLKPETSLLVQQLLTSHSVLKIGHGTDSLDIPAIYSYLGDKTKIIDFTLGLYDTRFLCEYENAITGSKLCNIYHLIEKFNVVTPKQFEWLKANEAKLGNFWNKHIDLANLSVELRDYSMYDALYLKKLLKQIKNFFLENQWDYKLVNQTTRVVFLLKRNVIEFSDHSFLNLCWIQTKTSTNTKLYELFYQFYNEWISLQTQSVTAIFTIGYFKNQLLQVLMHGFYLLVCNIYQTKVYKSSTQTISYDQINGIKESWTNLVANIKLFGRVHKIITNFLKFAEHRL